MRRLLSLAGALIVSASLSGCASGIRYEQYGGVEALPAGSEIRLSLLEDGAVLRVERWEGECDVAVPVGVTQADPASVRVEFGVPFSLEAEWRRITGGVCPAVAQLMVSDIELPHPVEPGSVMVRIIGLLPAGHEQIL